MSKLDDIMELRYPRAKVVANKDIDDNKAEMMSIMMEHYRNKFKDDIKALMQEPLDALEQSIKQHTVPEGRDLVSKSYVLNSIEFERKRVAEL